jgi:hypothetical protein
VDRVAESSCAARSCWLRAVAEIERLKFIIKLRPSRINLLGELSQRIRATMAVLIMPVPIMPVPIMAVSKTYPNHNHTCIT